MTDEDVVAFVCRRRVIPVVVIDERERAAAVGEALKEGGLPVAEITLRTSAALEAIRILARDPELLVGAGTVIRPDQVDMAHDAGAAFVVTPGISVRVLERCHDLAMPVIPGVATATEVITALEHDITLLKFFPAEASGGVAALQALSGPFPEVRFVPTGGVSDANARDYLALPSVAAIGGSWMVSAQLIRSGDFAAIARLAADAVRLAA